MKILSLNLWNINKPLNIRMDVLERYLSVELPDCICFQEISKVNGRLQIENILSKLHYQFTYCLSGFWKEREEGLVIATRMQHKLVVHEDLPLIENDMSRIFMGIELEHPLYGLCYIFNTHLAYHITNGAGRMTQIKVILDCLLNYVDKGIVILCGDLNEDPFQGEMYQFIKDYKGNILNDTCDKTLLTFSGKNRFITGDLWPDRKIDYIFYNGNINLKSSLVMVDGDGYGCCSDHYGLLAEDY